MEIKKNFKRPVPIFFLAFFIFLTWFSPTKAQTTDFVISVKTSNPGISASNQFTIPTNGAYTYNYSVNWGDGNFSTGVSGDITHTYAAPGTYAIRISGTFPAIYFNGGGDGQKLFSIDQWGSNMNWESFNAAFYGCLNMDVVATDSPVLTGVTDLSNMFWECYALVGNTSFNNWNTGTITNMNSMFNSAYSFNQNIGNWNTGNVKNFSGMFESAYDFNQNIGAWNTGNGTDMSYMFAAAIAFNQNIGNWNTGQVTNMTFQFDYANAFNQPIGNWNTAQVTNMSGMFYSAGAFNQPIGNWNTGQVTNMSNMFGYANVFNQDIGAWNTSQVTDMSNMFYSANVFNQNIGAWNTSNVMNMSFLFYGAKAFNQAIGTWNTAKVTNMTAMFLGAHSFNQPIGAWNTSQVSNMSYMFFGASAFNQNIGNWNTGMVTNMSSLFNNAISFNQNIGNWNTGQVMDMSYIFNKDILFNQNLGNWNTSKVVNFNGTFYGAKSYSYSLGKWYIFNATNMDSFLDSSGLSTSAYDSTLIGWNNAGNTFHTSNFGAAGLQYCLANTQRANLISTYNFTPSGDTYSCAFTIKVSSINVTCNGGNDGSISVKPNGGTPPYSYSDDGGSSYQGSNLFNALASGTYSIMVMDASGSTQFTMVTISQPAPISLYDVGGGGAYCSGQYANITLSNSDIGVNYQLQLGGVNTGPMIQGTGSGLSFQAYADGNYSIIAINSSSGCTGLMNGTVSTLATSLPNSYTVSGGGAICSTGMGQTINLNGSQTGVHYQFVQQGLTAQYWNNESLSGTPNVTQVDSTINYPEVYGFGPSGINTTQYSVRWSGYLVAPVSGNYTFTTVSDDGIRLWVNGNLLINDWSIHTPSTDNSITVNLIAGQTYPIILEYFQNQGGAQAKLEWSYPGQSTQIIPATQFLTANTSSQTLSGTGNSISFTNITTAGTYQVIATNTTGCTQIMNGTAIITLVAPPTTASVTKSKNDLCPDVLYDYLNGNTPTTGIGTWTQISGPNSLIIQNPNSGGSLFMGFIVGTYVLQWSITNGNCSSTVLDTIICQANTLPNPGPDQNLCNLTSTTLAGNTPVYGIGTWSQYSGPIATILNPHSPNAMVTGLVPGNYQFIWTIDFGGCGQGQGMIIQVYAPPTSSNAGSDQNLCNVSSTKLQGNTPAIGTGLWTEVTGPNTATIQNPDSANTQVNGLIPGTYTFAWTISNGSCSPSTAEVNLYVSAPPTPAFAGPNETQCSWNNYFNLNGNTPTLGTGSWTQISGPNTGVFSDPNSVNSLFSGLVVGTYVLEWTITNGSCSSSSIDTLTIVPAPTNSNAGPDQYLCNVSSTTMAANTPVYGVGSWIQTAGTPVTITDPNSPTTTITGLSPGTYDFQWQINLLVGGCGSGNLMHVIVSAPPTPASTVDTIYSYPSTLITLSANTPVVGTGLWTQISGPNIGTFSNPNSPSSTFYGLLQGTYILQWTITNGSCSSSAMLTLVNTPLLTQSNAGPNQTLACGSTTATTLAGNNPKYGTGLWSEVSGPNTALIVNPGQYNSIVNGLIPGTYNFQWTITGPNDTTSISTMSITVPPLLNVQIILQTNILCFGNPTGSATVSGSGGIGPYTYTWNTIPLQIGPTASNLPAGMYTVTVIDSMGCTGSSNISISQPAAALSASISSQTNVLCFGNSTGAATVSPSGGTGPYTYSWNSSPVQTGATATGLASGTYTVTVTDANNCTTTASVTITQPAAALSASISSQTNVFCYGNATGSATVVAQGGVSSYTYSWNTLPAQTTATATGLPAGTYTVMVSDSNHCTTTATVMITQPPAPLRARLGGQMNVVCHGNSTGSAWVEATGGYPPYTYMWNTVPVQTGDTAMNLGAGSYTVIVTDGGGCSMAIGVTITESAALVLRITNPAPVTQPFTVDITPATVTSGSTPDLVYTYYQDSMRTQTLSNPKAISQSGTYYILGTYVPGCQIIGAVQVQVQSSILPNPKPFDSVLADSGMPLTILGIPQSAQAGTYPVDPSSVNFSPGNSTLQNNITLPGIGTIMANSSGTLVFTSLPIFSGTVSIPYTLSDSQGEPSSSTGILIITVLPKVNRQTVITGTNTPIVYNELAKDNGNLDPGSVLITTMPKNGTVQVDPVTGTIHYVPNPGYSGTDSLAYRVCDKTIPIALCSNPGSLIFTVLPIADLGIRDSVPPVVDMDTYTYTLIVTNYGPAKSSGILVTDTLPKGMSLVNLKLSAGNYQYNAGSNILTWSLPFLLNRTSDTLVVTVHTTHIDSITNRVYGMSSSIDPNLTNNASISRINKLPEPLVIPTMFSPNGDGINDNFEVSGLPDYPENYIQIFNRWGNEVYQASGYMQGATIWNGSNLSDGTYFYVLRVNIKGVYKQYSGYTTIIRTGRK